MAGWIFRSSLLRMVAIAFVTLPLSSVLAFDQGPVNKPETLDCGDSGNGICLECCLPSCGEGKIACCRTAECDITNKPPANVAFPLVQLQLSAGGAQLEFEREWRQEGNRQVFGIKLRQVFRSAISKKTISMKTRLIGEDAAAVSMLYPVAFLGMGANALNALHDQGYEFSMLGAAPSDECQEMLPAETCMFLAKQLARGIEASLAVGADADRDAFLQGLGALGFAPCQFTPELE